jgi:hypothetical protein
MLNHFRNRDCKLFWVSDFAFHLMLIFGAHFHYMQIKPIHEERFN